MLFICAEFSFDFEVNADFINCANTLMDQNKVENFEIAEFASKLECLLDDLSQPPPLEDTDVSPWHGGVFEPAVQPSPEPRRSHGRIVRAQTNEQDAGLLLPYASVIPQHIPKEIAATADKANVGKLHSFSLLSPAVPSCGAGNNSHLAFRAGHTVPKALHLLDRAAGSRRGCDAYDTLEDGAAAGAAAAATDTTGRVELWPGFSVLRSPLIVSPLLRPSPARRAQHGLQVPPRRARSELGMAPEGRPGPSRSPVTALRRGAAAAAGERAALEERVLRVLEQVIVFVVIALVDKAPSFARGLPSKTM